MSVFSNQLVKWYRLNFRQLPWRETVDPYKIWVSEIILQQTRVAQGLPYYQKFIARFPDVKKMAMAKESEILQLWQGLGYYSRARNMHYTARQVMEKHKGKFPSSYEELISLKGIGEYTAAAVSSFSTNEKRAVVDGNVFRVLARVFGIEEAQDSTSGKKIFRAKAHEILPSKDTGIHNQAIMEFGSLQCVPVNPRCENCIFSKTCIAFLTGKVNELPVKKKKTKITDRYLNYYVFTDGKSLVMKKRTDKDIWQGLYDFPLVESENEKLSATEKKAENKIKKLVGIKNKKGEIIRLKHQLSHQNLFIRFEVHHLSELKKVNGFEIVSMNPKKFPGVPQVIMKLLKNENWFRKA